jgi:DNA-binding FadR family transcriptional regulator
MNTGGKRIAEQIASSLRDRILGGRLPPGEALPSERELAEQFDVNRSSVREALHRLEAVGLVEMRHGGATRVRDFLVGAGLHVLPWLIAPGGRLDEGWLRDLHEVRAMFLSFCAEQAARKATIDDVERLEALAAQLADPKAKPERLQTLDWRFFEALVATTQNRILTLITSVVHEVYVQHAARFASIYEQGVFDPRHHAVAVEAIRRRDGADAAAAMRRFAESALKARP